MPRRAWSTRRWRHEHAGLRGDAIPDVRHAQGCAVTQLPAAGAPVPLLGMGRVRHRRLRPVVHAFDYPTWFLLLPMRQLRAQPSAWLRRNRAGWVSFHDSDHGDGRADCLQWLDALLADAGLLAAGEVWLHTYPRMLGHAFKPVSFWYCHGSDGALVAIVAEVNNTFGGRHAYLLTGPQLQGWGGELQATKVLQVSPFCRVEGNYRFRFMRTDVAAGAPPAAASAGAPRTVVRIAYDDATGPLLTTSVSGDLAPLTPARLRRALLGMPLLTLGVVARIHWQALRLLARRVPFFGKSPAVVETTAAIHPR
jgi:uncharacterized protein